MADRDPILRGALYVLAAYELALGVFMVVAPGAFFDLIGPFGVRNDHYIRDNASWELALGVVALVAARRPAWRLPVLGVATLHFALHALSHLRDVGNSDPGWLGPVEAVALVFSTALLALLARRATAADGAGPSNPSTPPTGAQP